MHDMACNSFYPHALGIDRNAYSVSPLPPSMHHTDLLNLDKEVSIMWPNEPSFHYKPGAHSALPMVIV